ncbi:hypothetical protein BH11MYX3_BH11MYX3_46050 [soil metagenome]
MPHSPLANDYADDAATELDRQPHWSTAPVPLGFYSYSEDCAAQEVHTERVTPLSLRPTWLERLALVWPRLAAPACGAIAGLILVVGYLAYANQPGVAIAATAAPIAIHTETIAMTVEAPVDEAPAREPTVSPISPVAKIIAATKRPAKQTKRVKRAPVRINDSTPLGDLRP